MKTQTKELRELIFDSEEILLMPFAQNALAAKIIEVVGFKAIGIGGYSTAADLLAVPDLNLLSMTEMAGQVRRLCNATQIPILGDGNTGYGNVLNVARTVSLYENAGAGGIILEDQVMPKRCGHMEGKEIISREEMVGKIRSAVNTRKDPDFVIVGRTDARAVVDLEEAIERGKILAEEGADAIFVEAPITEGELRRIPNEIDVPVVANMIEAGKTPFLNAQELQEMGFSIIFYPMTALYSAAKAMTEILRILLETGTSNKDSDKLLTFKEFNSLVELEKYRRLEEKFLPQATLQTKYR